VPGDDRKFRPGTFRPRKFRPDVEGLRAIAVALVVLCHAGVPLLSGGYVGVDVFFVLSGFVITGLLMEMRTKTGKIATLLIDFYARRARRILPAATLVLVCTVVASYHWLGFLAGNTIAEDGQWTALFAANLHFALQGTEYLNAQAPPSPLQHYWSLAVEEQFYLVWPLLFLIAASVGRKVSLRIRLAAVLVPLIMASFLWSAIQTPQDGVWAYFSPLTRAGELGIGALLAVMAPMLMGIPARFGSWMSWGGIAGIMGSAFLFNDATAFPGFAAALPVLATALVVAGGTVRPGGGAEVILGRRPFQWLGKRSYSLYLWHWPLLTIAAEYAGGTIPLVASLGWCLAALGLAFVTYHVVENPVRHAKLLKKHPVYSLVLGALLVLSAFATCTWEFHIHQ
jgi:peptidoglycan/LPS O-acetylase OafA/YrhL